jgi:bifunctional DNA-binding transcriptional regulator/antitoxin component of YhaV-PrlF toxin-antitoxin module
VATAADLDFLARWPQGPIRVPKNGQVVIPKDLRVALRINDDDPVYFRLDTNPPTGILIIPGTYLDFAAVDALPDGKLSTEDN